MVIYINCAKNKTDDVFVKLDVFFNTYFAQMEVFKWCIH